MTDSPLRIFILFFICLLHVNGQAPIQGNSNLVEWGQKVITTPPTTSTGAMTVQVLLYKVNISTTAWRKPFITLGSLSDFRTYNNKKFELYVDRLMVSSNQFNLRLDFTNYSPTLRNFALSSIVKFYYLALSSTLPDVYVSDRVNVLGGNIVSFPATFKTTQSYGGWTGFATLNLMLASVRFVHSIYLSQFESMTLDNKFSVKLSFLPVATTKFNITVTSANSQRLKNLKVAMFIYDQAAFDLKKLTIRDGYWVVPAFGPGPQLQTFTTTGWTNYPGMHAMTGLAGFQFATPSLGFQLRPSLTTYQDILTITVQNFFFTSISIPKLQVSFLTVSQLKCPNGEPLLDSTLSTCLTSCPAGSNPATTPLGITKLYVCSPCTTCCPNGQFLNGVCVTCMANCQICSTSSTCILCNSGYQVSATGTCVTAIICTPPCIACDALGCNDCSLPFIVSGGACACPAGTVQVSSTCQSCTLTLANCVSCSSPTVCDQCDFGYYLTASMSCSPCSTGCINCDATGCIDCLAILTLNATGSCVCGTGLFFNEATFTCDTCTLSNCLECSSATFCIVCSPGFFTFLGIGTCQPCSPSCLACDHTGCLTCAVGYVLFNDGISNPPIICKPCSTIFNGLCADCTPTACLSCTASSTITAGNCTCPAGKGVSGTSCGQCNTAITNCALCTTVAACNQCDPGFYVTAAGLCASCPAGCITCDTTGCTSCQSFLTLNTVRKTCVCPVGNYLNSAGSNCLSCSTALTGCVECSSSTVCTLCSTGYYIKTGTTTCSVCGANCLTCDNTGCLTCQSGFATTIDPTATPPIICKACNLLYHASCMACDSISCTTCTSPFVVGSGTCVCPTGMTLSGGTCVTCASLMPNCYTCSSTTVCLVCNTNFILDAAGVCVCIKGLYFDGTSSCLSCGSAMTGCLQCSSSTACTLCAIGFYQPSGSSTCTPCSANCTSCDTTGCLTCQAGFTIFTDTTVAPSIICKSCVTLYGQCLTCDATQCLTCATDYFWYASANRCVGFFEIVCGDGWWIDIYETCDDGNVVSGDGCSASCQPETDYVCLLADKLPSGASFCKFTKDFSVVFDHLEKQISSNVVNIYLNIQPPTFTQWTQQSIMDLINPVTIINQQTGVITTIPVNSISISFTRNAQTNEIQLTIDYGENNLENSYLNFNVNPTKTNHQAIQMLAVQSNLMVKIQSAKTGVFLFGYSQDTYATQSAIGGISTAIGSLALIMAFLGLFIPSGKLVVIEALAVVQISYFSVLQFNKIPPTFAGFKNLILSNGYNDPNIFSQAQTDQDIYRLMGLKTQAASNFNISLLLFVTLPALIGGIGLLVTKFTSKPSIESSKPLDESTPEQKMHEQVQQNLQSKQNKDSQENSPDETLINTLKTSRLKTSLLGPQNINSPQKQQNPIQSPQPLLSFKSKQSSQNPPKQIPSLREFIFERILYENTFYGIFLTSYLAWISVFHSFSSFDAGSIVVMLLFLGLVVGFGYQFFKSAPQRVDVASLLKLSSQKYRKTDSHQDLKLVTKFGQFSQMSVEKAPNPADLALKIPSKIALLFLTQRLITGLCVIFISPSISFVGIFITLVYGGLFVGLMLISKKLKAMEQQRKRIEEQKQRQNKDKVIIEVEGRVLVDNFLRKIEKPSPLMFFYQNYLLRHGVNSITVVIIQILYLIANVTMKNEDPYQTFVNNSTITRLVPILISTLLALNMVFNIFLWVLEVKFDKILVKGKMIWSKVFSEKKQLKIEIESKSAFDKKNESDTQKQEQEVVTRLNKFIQTSAMFQKKESPFLGIQQKQVSKDALLGLFKVEEGHKIKMSKAGTNIRNKLINDFWDEI